LYVIIVTCFFFAFTIFIAGHRNKYRKQYT